MFYETRKNQNFGECVFLKKKKKKKKGKFNDVSALKHMTDPALGFVFGSVLHKPQFDQYDHR